MNDNLVASPFTNSPAGTALAEIPAGEIVQSLTYRESRTPYAAPAPVGSSGAGSLLGHAPDLLRSAAGGAWALVIITAAGGLIVLLVLAVVRVAGWLA